MWVRSYGRKSRALGDPEEMDVAAIVSHQLAANDRALAGLGFSLRPEERLAEIGSGESIESRPTFEATLKDLERHPPGEGIFAVTEIARISRADMYEFGWILRVFVRAGIKVLCGGRLFDLSRPDDELFFQFLAGLARHEVRNYSHRVSIKKDQLTRNGELTSGRAPFGYEWVKGRGKQRGRLEPIDDKLGIVQMLFRDAVFLSIPKLAAKYEMRQNTVNYILRNPVYTGYPHRHTSTIRASGKRSSTYFLPEEKWLRAEQQGDYPPAISVEQFYAVRDALRRRFVNRSKTGDSDGWCRQLLILEDWPHGRVTLNTQAPHADPCYTFTDRVTGCSRNYLREPIHNAAREKILAALADPLAIEEAIHQEQQRRLDAESGGERDRLRAELQTLRSKYADLKVQAAGSDPEDLLALETAQSRVSTQINAVKAALGGSGAGPHAKPFPQALCHWLPRLGPHAADLFDESHPAEKAELAEELLQQIVVRIRPQGRPRPSEREIVAIDYAEWFKPYAERRAP
jgi:DNA invertase Pin-like site-specific DNA recombinase